MTVEPEERARRWRLVLGGAPDGEGTGHRLGGGDTAIDAALAALYDSDRAGSDGAIEPDWSTSSTISRCTARLRRPYPMSRSGMTVPSSGR